MSSSSEEEETQWGDFVDPLGSDAEKIEWVDPMEVKVEL
jgi:hypothetical protein